MLCQDCNLRKAVTREDDRDLCGECFKWRLKEAQIQRMAWLKSLVKGFVESELESAYSVD